MKEASVIIEGRVNGIDNASSAFTVAAAFLVKSNEIVACICEVLSKVSESLSITAETMDVVDNAFSRNRGEGRVSIAG